MSSTEREGNEERATGNILEEIQLPENRGLLGGRSLVISPRGGNQRITRIPFCDICGVRLGERYLVCPACGRKVDANCFVSIEDQGICTACLRARLPLSKRAYKVLVCAANNVANTHVIEQVTRIGNREVRQILEELLAFSLVEKKGVFIFSTFKINDSGLVALGALRHIFGKDADVRYFDLALREFLTARSTVSQESKLSG